MNYDSQKIIEYDNFENGWGFYVDLDIENSYPLNDKHDFVKEKYLKTCYYNSYDKIEEELEYYEYNKKKQEESKQVEPKQVEPKQEEQNIIRNNSSSLLFNISSLTLITAALSYCFLAAL